MQTSSRAVLALLACVAASCTPTTDAPSPPSRNSATPAQPATAGPMHAQAGHDPTAGTDADARELPPDAWHGNWRLIATDDPHAQALMAFGVQSSDGEPQASGDYVLFQPFCDALDGRPIRGTSECESIGQGAAFARVQATPERLLLVFHPVADGSEHRLELRRDGERLTGEYVAEANDIRRAVIAERAPDDAR